MTADRMNELDNMSTESLWAELELLGEWAYEAKTERNWKLVSKYEVESAYIDELLQKRGEL